jgi:hypothetical protein
MVDFSVGPRALWIAVANGILDRWRLTLLIVTDLVGAALLFFGWDIGARLLGVWIVLIISICIALLIAFNFSKNLIGRRDQENSGARSSSVVLALLLAALASPEIVSVTAKTLATCGYAAAVLTPALAEQMNHQIGSSISVDALGNRANTILFSQLSSAIGMAIADTHADGAGWIWFLIVFTSILFLARALVQSYDAMSPKPDSLTPARPPLMNYPKWLAVCLYAAILVPATYFSLGALLKLGLDSKGTEASIVQTQLREAGAAAMEAAPGSPVNLDKIASRLQLSRYVATTPPLPKDAQPPPANYVATLDRVQGALTNARGATTRLEAWRADYEAASLRQMTSFKRIATADQFSDHVTIVAAKYRAEILSVRAQIRPCMIGLSDIEAGFGDKNPAVIELNLADAVVRRCAEASEALDRRPPPPPPILCGSTCPTRPSEALSGASDSGCLTCQGGVSDMLYGWMADISDSAVLIVGLIGFGLFGASIRMLGRPDEVVVTEGEFTAARMEAESAHRLLKEKVAARLAAQTAYDETRKNEQGGDQEKQTFEGAQKEEQEARAVATTADNGLAALERRATEGRSNFVVDRVTNTPEGEKHEYVISGAPAKVLVSGLGAAFTVFLAGKAGVQIFTDGGRTSPTGLLLACFVGAVFAENIWRSVSDTVNKRTAPAPSA